MTDSGPNIAGIEAFVRPRSVAIVGASESNPRSFGSLALRNLLDRGYSGPIAVVHPSADVVFGVPAYPSLDKIGFAPDLCVIAIRAEAVPQAMQEAAALGARAVSVVGSGFAEAGTPEGVELQRRVVELSRSTEVRLLGPNSIGGAGFADDAVSAASANIPQDIPAGSVAIVSQSGGLGSTILATASRYQLGVKSFIALGNESDVSAADAIAFAVSDGASAVLCYLETLRDPAAFTGAARLAREAGIPIVMLKGGTQPGGQAIAASHTASLAGSMRVFDAVLGDLGVARVSSIESLISTGMLFESFGPAPGTRLGAFGLGGGNCALLADSLEQAGLQLAELTPETSEHLKATLPDSNGSIPFDAGGWFLGKNTHLLEEALREVSEDPGVDIMVYGMVPLARIREEVYVAAIAGAAKASNRPAISMSMHSPMTEYRLNAYRDTGIVELSCTAAATEALGVWIGTAKRLGAAVPAVDAAEATTSTALALPADILQELQDNGQVVLLEDRATAVLSGLGLCFPANQLADTEAEAVAAAKEIGFPVVVKAIAEGLLHRAQIGAVSLGVTEDTVGDAVARVAQNARRAVPPDTAIQLFVQRQVGAGTEMIVGLQKDPVFGSVVVIGLGGVLSELLDDVAFGVPPLTQAQARAMFDGLRAAHYLHKADERGELHVQAFVDLAVRVGDIAVALGSKVESLDLNPVIVNGDGVVVVDALAVLTLQ